MNEIQTTTAPYLAEYKLLQASLAGQKTAWVKKLRKAALNHFSEIGFPTASHEDWKYTRVTAIEDQRLVAASMDLTQNAMAQNKNDIHEIIASNLNVSDYTLVFINGYYSSELSQLGELAKHITITHLASVLEQQPEMLKPYLGQYADYRVNGFAALNLAFMTDGAYLYIPENTVLAKPIQLLFIATTTEIPFTAYPRNLIIAGNNSQTTIIENYISFGNVNHLTNTVTEIITGKNAVIEHYKLQQESNKAFHIGSLQVYQEQNSRFISHSLSLGATIARHDINIALSAEHAACELHGLYLANGKQHVDHHTFIDHLKPHGVSREYYKGILDNFARGVFNGKVLVRPNAQHTDTHQSNNNLLLSDNAEVDTKPQLEIYADDVRCTHGATVGQLDEQALFYLRARGITATVARSLLIYAFANDIIDKIKSSTLRAHLQQVLLNRLPAGATVREML